MANTLYPTSFVVNSTFATLASYLASAGFSDIVNNPIAGSNGYIINHDTAIDLYIGFGTGAPTSYEIVGPYTQLPFLAGANVNEIWIKAASSTISVGFCEGASMTVPPLVNGVIGTITATENVVPKADANGDLVASSISDSGTAVTIGEPTTVTGKIASTGTTPIFETASGQTNTGYLNLKGKTSGALKVLPADAMAQTVTIAPAAQTSGASTLTIPDLAGVDDEFCFKTKSLTLANKTLTSPVIATGLTASGSASNDFSGSTGTFKTSSGANTISGAATFSDLLTTVTGTTALANINTPAGTLKTTPAAGDLEFDGVNRYSTNNATSGRAAIAAQQYFRLTATGSTISTIANYFGANSNPVLVSGGYYEIEIYAWFLNSTAGTVTWTLINSAAPTAQDIYYEMSPITGLVAPPGTATMLVGQIYNDATASKAVCTTGTLTDAANHYMHMRIWLQNGTGTSLQIQATKNVGGTITPGIGSRWFCRRLPASSTGNFAS